MNASQKLSQACDITKSLFENNKFYIEWQDLKYQFDNPSQEIEIIVSDDQKLLSELEAGASERQSALCTNKGISTSITKKLLRQRSAFYIAHRIGGVSEGFRLLFLESKRLRLPFHIFVVADEKLEADSIAKLKKNIDPQNLHDGIELHSITRMELPNAWDLILSIVKNKEKYNQNKPASALLAMLVKIVKNEEIDLLDNQKRRRSDAKEVDVQFANINGVQASYLDKTKAILRPLRSGLLSVEIAKLSQDYVDDVLKEIAHHIKEFKKTKKTKKNDSPDSKEKEKEEIKHASENKFDLAQVLAENFLTCTIRDHKWREENLITQIECESNLFSDKIRANFCFKKTFIFPRDSLTKILDRSESDIQEAATECIGIFYLLDKAIDSSPVLASAIKEIFSILSDEEKQTGGRKKSKEKFEKGNNVKSNNPKTPPKSTLLKKITILLPILREMLINEVQASIEAFVVDARKIVEASTDSCLKECSNWASNVNSASLNEFREEQDTLEKNDEAICYQIKEVIKELEDLNFSI